MSSVYPELIVARCADDHYSQERPTAVIWFVLGHFSCALMHHCTTAWDGKRSRFKQAAGELGFR